MTIPRAGGLCKMTQSMKVVRTTYQIEVHPNHSVSQVKEAFSCLPDHGKITEIWSDDDPTAFYLTVVCEAPASEGDNGQE